MKEETGTTRERPGFDPAQDIVLEPRMLKGLAHPLRVRLRSELIEGGPATASQLAARVGESSGATSYHLRQLEAYGFVTDVPEMGNGRDRFWRAVHRATWFDLPQIGGDRAIGGEYTRAVARWYAERLVRFADSVEAVPDVLGAEWAGSYDLSDWLLDLDASEAADLARHFHELCLPYRYNPGAPTAPGKRRVAVRFQIMPTSEAAE